MRRTRTAPAPIASIAAIADFIQFVARSATSQRQRQRLNTAASAPATGAEIDALRCVRNHDPVTMTTLAERLGLDRTTVSRVVRRLEELELVTRTVDQADLRRAWVSVAPAGRRLLTALDNVSTQDYIVATSEWTDGDRAALAELLFRLKRDLQRLRFDENGRATRLSPLLPPTAEAS